MKINKKIIGQSYLLTEEDKKEIEKILSEDKLKLFACSMFYEGMCGFAASGSNAYVFNNSSVDKRVLVEITGGWGTNDVYVNIAPLQKTYVGCTSTDYNPPAKINYRIIREEGIESNNKNIDGSIGKTIEQDSPKVSTDSNISNECVCTLGGQIYKKGQKLCIEGTQMVCGCDGWVNLNIPC